MSPQLMVALGTLAGLYALRFLQRWIVDRLSDEDGDLYAQVNERLRIPLMIGQLLMVLLAIFVIMGGQNDMQRKREMLTWAIPLIVLGYIGLQGYALHLMSKVGMSRKWLLTHVLLRAGTLALIGGGFYLTWSMNRA